jgi:hypothetical protein
VVFHFEQAAPAAKISSKVSGTGRSGQAGRRKGNISEKSARMITDRSGMLGFLRISVLAAVRGATLFIFPSC